MTTLMDTLKKLLALTLDNNNKDSEILRTNKDLFATLHGLAVVCDKLGQSKIALSFYTRIVEFCREDFGSECLFVGHIASRIGNIILESFLENFTALEDFKTAEQYLLMLYISSVMKLGLTATLLAACTFPWHAFMPQ